MLDQGPFMLAEWHEFYALIGTAAAALVALLFVAASILANVFTAESRRRHAHLHEPGRLPLHQHFVPQSHRARSGAEPDDIFALSSASPRSAAWSIRSSSRCACSGTRFPILPDRLAYGARRWPPIRPDWSRRGSYSTDPRPASMCWPARRCLLLVVNIRNAWDLMLSLARRNALQRQKDASASQPPSP